MSNIASLLFLIFFSSVKFLFSAPLAILQYKLPYWEAVLWTSIGGWAGVVVFAFLSKQLGELCVKVQQKIIRSEKRRSRKTFTFRNRVIIKIKQKYGLPGLVIFTPIMISIPIGAFLAERYYPGSRTIYLLLASVLFWSLTLNAFYSFFV